MFFINDHECMISSGIETTKGGRIILRGKTWKYQDCKFTFRELSETPGCPKMLGPTCDMYDGAICCAQKCQGNALSTFMILYCYTLEGASICFDQITLPWLNSEK